jgi:ribosomal protein S2
VAKDHVCCYKKTGKKEIVTEAARRVTCPFVTELVSGGKPLNFNTVRKCKRMQGDRKIAWRFGNRININLKETSYSSPEKEIQMDKVLGWYRTKLVASLAALYPGGYRS